MGETVAASVVNDGPTLSTSNIVRLALVRLKVDKLRRRPLQQTLAYLSEIRSSFDSPL